MGYKLEWNGLSLIYTSDTSRRPSASGRPHGGKGVDVSSTRCSSGRTASHEELRARVAGHSVYGFEEALEQAKDTRSLLTRRRGVRALLSRIDPGRSSRPPCTSRSRRHRRCALNSVRKHSRGQLSRVRQGHHLADRLMVLKVKKGKNGKPPVIEQFMGEVSEYTFAPPSNVYGRWLTRSTRTDGAAR